MKVIVVLFGFGGVLEGIQTLCDSFANTTFSQVQALIVGFDVFEGFVDDVAGDLVIKVVLATTFLKLHAK